MTLVAPSASKAMPLSIQPIGTSLQANTAWNMNPVAFIDDDAAKVHRWIVGVPVRGSIDSLEATMRQYGVDEVILSSRAINGSVAGMSA